MSDEEAGPAPRLLACRCQRCGRLTFPRQSFCPGCWAGAEALHEEELPPRGTVYACSVARVGSAGIEPPYAAGMVDLEDGTRVSARFADPEGVRVGDPVEVVSTLVGDDAGAAVGCLFEVSR